MRWSIGADCSSQTTSIKSPGAVVGSDADAFLTLPREGGLALGGKYDSGLAKTGSVSVSIDPFSLFEDANGCVNCGRLGDGEGGPECADDEEEASEDEEEVRLRLCLSGAPLALGLEASFPCGVPTRDFESLGMREGDERADVEVFASFVLADDAWERPE